MGIKFETVFFLIIVLVASQLFTSLANESSFKGRMTLSAASEIIEDLGKNGKADQGYQSHARKSREHFRFLKGGGGRGGGGSFSGGSGVSGMKVGGSGGGGGGGSEGKKSAALKAEVPAFFSPCMSLVLTLIHLI